jgi:hypothetical protein
MVAISTPVRSVDGRSVIGVLARTQHLWELLADYERQAGTSRSGENGGDSAAEGRFLALVDSRDWRLVAHPWMTRGHLEKLSNEDADRLAIPKPLHARIARSLQTEEVAEKGEAATLDLYIDPVGASRFGSAEFSGEWLAALRPIPESAEDGNGWLAVVQERKDAVLAPAERMKSELLLYAAAALAVGGGLIVTFWYFVTQAITGRAAAPPRRRPATAVDGGSVTP